MTQATDRSTGGLTAAPLAALLVLLLSSPVLAHTGQGVASGLLSGFLHPLTGIDHLLAMVAVGIWGTQLGRPAIWLLPLTFPARDVDRRRAGRAGRPAAGRGVRHSRLGRRARIDDRAGRAATPIAMSPPFW